MSFSALTSELLNAWTYNLVLIFDVEGSDRSRDGLTHTYTQTESILWEADSVGRLTRADVTVHDDTKCDLIDQKH